MTDEEARLAALLRRTRLDLIATDRRLHAALQSHSWEVTRPARWLGDRAPGLARLLLRLHRVLTRLVTGQLAGHLRVRYRQRRRAAAAPPRPADPAEGTLAPEELAPPRPAAGGQTILIVYDTIPRPDRGAGSRNIQSYLDIFLAEGWAVVYAPFDGRDAGAYTQALVAQGILVIDGRVKGGLAGWLACHGASLSQVMLMHPEPADALLPDVLRHTSARLSYYGHDLHSARLRLQADIERNGELAEISERVLAVERRIWRTVDVVLYPSESEAATVRALAPGVAAFAVPVMAFDTVPPPHPPPAGASLLFVGGFSHPPNADGIIWFVHEVLPLVREAVPTVRLVIAGSEPPPEVRALVRPDIEVTGYLSDADLAERYAQARVVVAPLRFGAGVKGKVVEAMRMGVPVVTTPVGAEGLEHEKFAVAIGSSNFCAEIGILIHDDHKWISRASAGIRYVSDSFSRRAMRDRLLAAL